MSGKLTIAKGGKLLQTEWVYDDEKEEGSYVTSELDDFAATGLLFEHCELADDITLRDIFLLLEKNLDFYQVVIRNWVEELVREGLDGPTVPDNESPYIDYLELYWHFEGSKFEGKRTLGGYSFPEFHGVSKALTEEELKDYPGFKAGDVINIAVDFTPTNKLMDLPVKLKKKPWIAEDDLDIDFKTADKQEVLNSYWSTDSYDDCIYTLGHILYGIIWELSFCGSPKDRDDKAEMLKERVESIKEEIK